MKHTGYFVFILTALIAGAASHLTAEPKGAGQMSSAAQKTFASPEEAVDALRAAAVAPDDSQMRALYGPDYDELKTGDKVQDERHRKKFAAALAEHCELTNKSDSTMVLEIGTNRWPMPVPLVKEDGRWHFDTAAGKEEIINRHIGRDELTAIGVCHDYIEAQREYARMNPEHNPVPTYARKFKSSPGKKDGLYWPASDGEPASPLGALVAEAHSEGYHSHHGTRPHPFHGYLFRILTRQGPDATGGKMNYMKHCRLTRGCALVAYPQYWGQSGIMTFIIDQDDKVYQRDLGDRTSQIASAMKVYNPDDQWLLVTDDGITNAALEK